MVTLSVLTGNRLLHHWPVSPSRTSVGFCLLVPSWCHTLQSVCQLICWTCSSVCIPSGGFLFSTDKKKEKKELHTISVHSLSGHQTHRHKLQHTTKTSHVYTHKYTQNHELEVNFNQVCRLNFYPHFNLCLVLLTKLSVSPAESASLSMILWAPGFTEQIVLNEWWAVTHGCQIQWYSRRVSFILCFFSSDGRIFHVLFRVCLLGS